MNISKVGGMSEYSEEMLWHIMKYEVLRLNTGNTVQRKKYYNRCVFE